MSRRTRDFESPASAIPPLRPKTENERTLSHVVGNASVFLAELIFSCAAMDFPKTRSWNCRLLLFSILGCDIGNSVGKSFDRKGPRLAYIIEPPRRL